ncbi:MAG: peptide deformylase [Oscillospiraceae bacterium]|nr:peptide deformylase [Oscillospiraceae bacterium]
MALRNILREGDPTLEKTSRPVEDFDERLHVLLDDMRETLDHADGVGLAAPQVGVLRQAVLVMDLSQMNADGDAPVIELMNPVVLETEGETERYEGCLSVPGVVGKVARPVKVRVRAQDRAGGFFEIEGEGITARALCHEIDHLEGKLYTRLCDQLYDLDNIPEEEEV